MENERWRTIVDRPVADVGGSPTFSRRSVLVRGAVAAGGIAAATGVGVAGLLSDPEYAAAAAYSATLPWKNSGRRLVRRVTYGITKADTTDVAKLGYQAYLNRQLNHDAVGAGGVPVLDDRPLDKFIATNFPSAMWNSQQWAAVILGTQPNSMYRHHDLYYASIVRAVHSKRQLFERMVEFWSDHFNVPLGPSPAATSLMQQRAIRPNALGKFPALLQAVAHEPAMLIYLSQKTNVYQPGLRAQENYARELMELHTMGVRSGYTQTDVQEVARCFTGWQTEVGDRDPTFPFKYIDFRFHADTHDHTAKTVLGVTIPATAPASPDGVRDGERVLTILAEHPATARFISTKLVRWFLGDIADPRREQIITQTAAAYKTTGGDIKAMLKVVLAEANVMASPAKFKRPFHLVASTLRSCQTDLLERSRPLFTDMMQFQVYQLQTMGHEPYGWFPPNGYPDSISYWGANLLPRYNYLLELTKNVRAVDRWNGVTWRTFYPLRRTAAGAINTNPLVAEISSRFFGAEMDPAEMAQVKAYLNGTGPNAPAMIAENGVPLDEVNDFTWRVAGLWEAINLGLCGPGFQWY